MANVANSRAVVDPSNGTRNGAATLKDHNLVPETVVPGVLYGKRPARRPDGTIAEGLFNAWITLDNPKQYNSYTTEMVKGVILAFRQASTARDVNCIVFTGSGDKPSAPAATRRNTPSTTPAIRRNIVSICACSMTW